MSFTRSLSAALAARCFRIARPRRLRRQRRRQQHAASHGFHAVEQGRSGERRLRARRGQAAGRCAGRQTQGRRRRHGCEPRIRHAPGRPHRRPGHRLEERRQHGHRAFERQLVCRQQAGRHQPPDRRAGAAGFADHAVRLRHARADARSGQHARHQCERPRQQRRRRAVQHRDRIQALLPHQDAGDGDRPATAAARSCCPTRRRPLANPNPTTPANSCFQPYDPASDRRRHWWPARRPSTASGTTGLAIPYIVRVERGTVNRGIYDIAVLFDPTKAWTATAPQPQWNGKIVYTFGASTGQPRRQYRSEQSWVDDSALVARLHGRRQQHERFALQLEPRAQRRDGADDEGARRRQPVRRDSSSRWATAARAARSGRTPRRRSTPACVDGIQVACDYPDSITTGIEVTDCVLLVNLYVNPKWQALDDGPDAGADQRQEGGDQRPPRPARLPVVEQLLRLQQQAGQLRAYLRRRSRPRAPSRRSAPRATTASCRQRSSTTR